MNTDTPPTFVIIGAAGDGKSSIIKKLIEGAGADSNDRLPDIGRDPGGITKDVRPYSISCFGEDMVLLDTMGIGDMEKGVGHLIAGLRSVLENSGEQMVDGIVVTGLIATSRLGLACQIVQQIIECGLVRDSGGVSPWERIIVCGTQRDRCDEEEIQDFIGRTGPLFFKDKLEPKEWQITTSTKKGDGMDDLLNCMKSMVASGRHHTTWDPNFDENGGSHRMAVGVCTVTHGDVDLQESEFEKQFAWSNLMITGLVSKVGRDLIRTHTAQQAPRKTVRTVALKEGSEKSAEKEGGVATFKSSTGNIVMDVAGTAVVPGMIGVGAQLVAGQFEATKEHKKTIGFSAQVGTAGCYGFCCGGGPAGAAVGVSVGALTWVASEVVGSVVEELIVDSRGKTDPAVIKYMEAKAKYDKLLGRVAA